MENISNKGLKIAILGYGKMGKEIEKMAIAKGHTILLTLDNEKDWIDKGNLLVKADVAIDFSMPKTVVQNIEKCFDNNVPIVVGTTAWYTDFKRISEVCLNTNQSLFYATNFSLGVNIFSAVNKKLAEIMNGFQEYDVEIIETHHTQKLDAPSGTAISLAEGILSKMDRKSIWKLEGEIEGIESNTLSIKAKRIENVPGTHEIRYESEADKIKIIHEAKNRKGFAKGAVLAAEWLVDKKGVYTMSDLLALNF